jgi:transposase-like protein
MTKSYLWGTEMKSQKLLRRLNVITEARYRTLQCKFCDSVNVVRYGLTAKGTQRYLCRNCKRTFLDNKAKGRMQYPIDAVALALNMFYESASLSKIQKQLQLTYGVSPGLNTIYYWIIRYSKKAAKTLNSLLMKAGSVWVADETVIKLKEKGGLKQWFWDIIDDKTRFLLASHMSDSRTTRDAQTLVEKAARRADRVPEVIRTDKLASYLDGIELAFGADTRHIQAKKLTAKDGTQLIERFHGTLKDRTKVMRSMMRKETARILMDGWLAHYNFFRPHQALKGKTPAEVAKTESPYKSWRDIVEKD